MNTRRGFLASVGASAPLLLGMTNKSGSAKPVLGSGEHTYEVTHDWGDLPADIKYGNTHGVCEDSRGHIYIHHTVNAASELSDSMVIFDHKGKFIKSWGKEFKGGAHGLHISREGRHEFLYLCDTKRAVVVKTTLDGEEVFSLGYPDESDAYKPGPDGKKKKYSPTNLAIAPNGDFYVGDGYGSSYINQYNKDGKYIRTFGGPGKEPGQLSCPHGLIVDKRGSEPILMVADRANNRIQTIYFGRCAHRLHLRHQPAVLFRLFQKWRYGRARPRRARDANGLKESGNRTPGRRFRSEYLERNPQADA